LQIAAQERVRDGLLTPTRDHRSFLRRGYAVFDDAEPPEAKLLAKPAEEERRDELDALVEEISRLMAVRDRNTPASSGARTPLPS
jgi:hypothetical protein